MYLDSISYTEQDDQGNDWKLASFSPEKINLIVGKNSTGKSRTINVLSALSSYVCGERKPSFSGKFNAHFVDGKATVHYILHFKDMKVEKELLEIDGTTVLDRGENGEGTILYEDLDNSPMIKFQVDESLLACVARRDSIQHPYFELLHSWGMSTRHYRFGTSLGREHLAVIVDRKEKNELNTKDTNNVVLFLRQGEKKLGKEFTNDIIAAINAVGYELVELGVRPVAYTQFEPKIPGTPEGIYIRERGHSHTVEQNEISQGLFRVISLFTQLRYSECFSEAGFILIDDIGEGIDYDRSTKLIKSLIKKAESSEIQLVMTTNDRFVMNNVPLQYWSIIQKKGSKSTFLNHKNSKSIFDKFEITGLSNFDFFSSKYYEQ